MADLASFEPLSNFMDGEGGRILMKLKQRSVSHILKEQNLIHTKIP